MFLQLRFQIFFHWNFNFHFATRIEKIQQKYFLFKNISSRRLPQKLTLKIRIQTADHDHHRGLREDEERAGGEGKPVRDCGLCYQAGKGGHRDTGILIAHTHV